MLFTVLPPGGFTLSCKVPGSSSRRYCVKRRLHAHPRSRTTRPGLDRRPCARGGPDRLLRAVRGRLYSFPDPVESPAPPGAADRRSAVASGRGVRSDRRGVPPRLRALQRPPAGAGLGRAGAGGGGARGGFVRHRRGFLPAADAAPVARGRGPRHHPLRLRDHAFTAAVRAPGKPGDLQTPRARLR